MIKTQSRLLALVILLSCLGPHVCADPIDFSEGWSEQRFSVFSSNEFEPSGETLHIRSDGTVSMFWSRLPPALWDSTQTPFGIGRSSRVGAAHRPHSQRW